MASVAVDDVTLHGLRTELADAEQEADRLTAENARLRAALKPFAEPHAMGDAYVKFASHLIEAARIALAQ